MRIPGGTLSAALFATGVGGLGGAGCALGELAAAVALVAFATGACGAAVRDAAACDAAVCDVAVREVGATGAPAVGAAPAATELTPFMDVGAGEGGGAAGPPCTGADADAATLPAVVLSARWAAEPPAAAVLSLPRLACAARAGAGARFGVRTITIPVAMPMLNPNAATNGINRRFIMNPAACSE